MKGVGQALKARLIPLRANRGPVFPHQAVCQVEAHHQNSYTIKYDTTQIQVEERV